MPAIDPVQTNFTSGELSPEGWGRADIEQYRNGAATLDNFIIDPKGPAVFRGGTEYIADSNAATFSTASRLVDFVPTSTTAYLIEIGDNFIKVMDRDGTQKFLSTSNGYAAADIWDITYEASGSTVYFYHPLYKPRELIRTDDTTWTWQLRVFENGPYINVDRNDTQLKIDSFVYRVTVESATTGDFTSVVVGDYVEWLEGSDWFLGAVTTKVSNEELTVEPVSYIVRDAIADLAPQRNAPSAGKLGSRIAGFNSIFEKAHYRFTDATDGKKSWVKGDYYEGTTGSTTLYDTMSLVDLGSSQYYISHDTAVANNFKPLYSTDSPVGATQLTGPLTVTEQTNTATVTANKALFNAGSSTAQDIDRWLLLLLGSQTLNVQIKYDASNTTTQVAVEPSSAPPREPQTDLIAADGTTEIWFLGAFYGQDGDAEASYPFSGQGFQQRQFLTGSPKHPDYVFASVTGEKEKYEPFDQDAQVLATSGISYNVDSDRTVIIRTITAKDDLLIGSEGGMFRGHSTTDGDTITPANFRVTPEESRGAIIPPVLVGTDILYIQRSGLRFNQMAYNIRVNSYEAQDTTILADHLFSASGTEAVDFCYKQEPISSIWVAKQDGTLTSLTYEKQQDVYAWAQHHIGGRTITSGTMLTNGAYYRIVTASTDFTLYGANNNETNTIFQSTGIPTLASGDELQEVGYVESLVSLPSTDKREDWVFLLVRRGDQKTIERISSTYRPAHNQDKTEMKFLDSITTIDLGGTPTTTVTDASLARFNGKTVTIVADGSVFPDVTVSGNSFTMQQPAENQVHVGWKYRGIIETLDVNTQGISGTNQGLRRRVHHINVKVHNSLGFQYGDALTNLYDEETAQTIRQMDISPPLYSGPRRVPVDGRSQRETRLFIVQDLPYPLTVLSLTPEIEQQR